jgi:hypothetical protein
MGRKIRLGQAGAPTTLYYTTGLMVQDMIRRSRLVQHTLTTFIAQLVFGRIHKCTNPAGGVGSQMARLAVFTAS